MERLLEALADPARLSIVRSLGSDGPQTQEELRVRFSISKSAASTHINLLLQSGLVARSTQRGSCELLHKAKVLTALLAIAELEDQVATKRSADARASLRDLRKESMTLEVAKTDRDAG